MDETVVEKEAQEVKHVNPVLAWSLIAAECVIVIVVALIVRHVAMM